MGKIKEINNINIPNSKIKFSIIAMILTMIVLVVTGTFALTIWNSNENTEVTVRIGDVASVYFDTGPNINVSNMGPVFNYEKDGASTNFKIRNYTNDKIALVANLNIDNISEELKRDDFKFVVLSSNDEKNYSVVNEGDFRNANSKTSLNLFTNEVLSSNAVVSYKVIIYIDANAENPIEMQNKSLSGTISVNSVDTGSLVIANSPAVLEGLIPVVHNGTTWVTADQTNYKNSWYDYDTKNWANAVLVSSTKKNSLTKDANGYYTPGQIIGDTESDGVLAFYVWIPRFKYKVWNIQKIIGTDSYDAENIGIDIVFERGTETTGTISCTYSYKNPSSNMGYPNETCSGNNGEYYTHPAFTFGDAQLTGFWIGKYELSSSAPSTANGGGNVTDLTPRLLPNVVSWRDNTISNFYKVVKDMQANGNIYGLSGNSVDSHLINNMEWGALAYLTHSGYGRCTNGICTEVSINDSSAFYTGRSAGVPGATTYSAAGTYTYDSSNGKLASTTGNITGVYDVSGGAYEYVMGNMSSASGSYNYYSHAGGNNFSYGDATSKYLTPYAYSTSYGNQTSSNRARLGDATGEVTKTTGQQGGWFGDGTSFVMIDGAWFMRGGTYDDESTSGIFFFGGQTGGYSYKIGTRSALSGVTTFTITYDANGGSGAPAAQTKSYGGVISLSSIVPTKEGYLFTGWNTKQDGTGEQYLAGSVFKVNDNITLYAQWGIKPIYVYYNVNGGTVTETTAAGSWTIDNSGFIMKNGNSILQIINTNSSTGTNGFLDWDDLDYMNISKQGYLAKTGYEYNTKPDGTGANFEDNREYSYDNLLSYVITEGDYYRLNLYVNWTPLTYTITYYLGNGTSTAGSTMIGTSTCIYGSSCTLNRWSNFGRTFPGSSYGWDFSYWTLDNNSTTKYKNDGETITYDTLGNLNLYAVGYNQYEFYSGVAPTTPSASLDTIQYWNPHSTDTSYLTSIVIPAATSISSWDFLGYVAASDTASSNVTYSPSTVETTITPEYNSYSGLRAVYSRTLTISYNSNGGTGTVSNQTATQYYNSGANSGGEITTPTFNLRENKFTKSNYAFFKWAIGSTDGTLKDAETNYSFGPSVGTTATTQTMYAIWRTYLRVYYYSNYATSAFSSATNTVSSSSNVIVRTYDFIYGKSYPNGLHNFSTSGDGTYLARSGYRTLGFWGTSTNGGILVHEDESFANGQAVASKFGIDISSSSKEINLYPQWQKVYTLTVEPFGGTWNGSTNSQDFYLSYGEPLTLGIPTRSGYTFDYWEVSCSDGDVNENIFTMGSSDCRVTAQWKSGSQSDTQIPTLTVTYPTGTSYGSPTTVSGNATSYNLTVKGTVSDNVSVSSVYITVTDLSNNSSSYYAATISGNNFSRSITVNPSGWMSRWKIEIQATDSSGNTNTLTRYFAYAKAG